MVLSLSGAAGIANMMSLVGDACDVSTIDGLWKMFISSTITTVIMVVTRGIHYPILVFKVLAMFYAEQNWKFFVICIPIFMIFELINLMYVFGGIARVKKFYKEIHEIQSDKTTKMDENTEGKDANSQKNKKDN